MELDKPDFDFTPPPPDRRPTLPEPLPVRLISVADVRLPCPADPTLGPALDDFYVRLLQFRRLPSDEHHHFFMSDNHALILQAQNRPVQHDRIAPTMIEVDHRQPIRQHLLEHQIEHEWMRGLTAGGDYLLLQDPAGNWVGILERSTVR